MYKYEVYSIEHSGEIDAETGYQTINFSVEQRGRFEEYLIDGELCRTGMSQIDAIFFDDETAEIREQLEDWLEENPAPEIEEDAPSL